MQDSSINPLERYNRYVSGLSCSYVVKDVKNIDIARDLLNLVVSKPVGDVIFKACVLAKFTWDSRAVKELSEDQLETKAGLKDELRSVVRRLVKVAAVVIVSVGILFAGIALGAAAGSALLTLAISTVGIVGPTYYVGQRDVKTAMGVIDLGSAIVTVNAFIAMRVTAVVGLAMRVLYVEYKHSAESNLDGRYSNTETTTFPEKDPTEALFY